MNISLPDGLTPHIYPGYSDCLFCLTTMEGYPAVKSRDSYPLLIPAYSAVLLIFMPLERADGQQRAALIALADSLQENLGGLLRVLRINEATHPDVVRSFAITQTPAFVLVRRGVELWRQEGMPDKVAIELLIQRLWTA